MRPSLLVAVVACAVAAFAFGVMRAQGSGTSAPALVQDVKTGSDTLTGATSAGSDAIQDYIQPDTEIEPSMAVNPANPKNVVTVYQLSRIADGGDATNGFATSFDGGKTWTSGALPGLTTFPGQGGVFERASDAVVAFGTDGKTVYANSLVFDFNNNLGLRSGIAVNVSKDGGKTWGPPVILQDDVLGGLNDKNWIVVDQSDAPGHHKGRVYVVWDRIAPVLVNYCDHDCDKLANWLPDFQTIPNVVFAGQGIGAFPVITKSGGLGIVMDADSGGVPVPSGPDELELQPGTTEVVFIAAPEAGSTPWPAPLAFLPPVDIAANEGAAIPAQRAGSLPSAAVDQSSGTIYAAWEDARYRSVGTNDAVISRSFDGGLTWTAPQRVNPGSTTDHADHYNVSVDVGAGGTVHVAYRERDESGTGPRYTDAIDTYYQESFDGGSTWTAPLKVDKTPSMPWYDAFSRDGSFEGDYNQVASSGGYTYIVRDQGSAKTKGEPAALVPNPDGSNTLVLTEAGKGHQHQATWVALVRNR
ncbi:MAG TPA: sialidase family protein [Gaiellaceae bacterium]|nr:sialidase family protein [Gaiellaceae bacterium]